MELLDENLATGPWSVGEIFDSPGDQYEFWFALFESVLEEHASKTKMRVRDKGVPYIKGTQRQFSENTCSEDHLRSRIFGTFVVKFLACLPVLGFLNM